MFLRTWDEAHLRKMQRTESDDWARAGLCLKSNVEKWMSWSFCKKCVIRVFMVIKDKYYPLSDSVAPEKLFEWLSSVKHLEILCLIFHWSCSLSRNSWHFSFFSLRKDSSSLMNSSSLLLSSDRWIGLIIFSLKIFRSYFHIQHFSQILNLAAQIVDLALRLI